MAIENIKIGTEKGKMKTRVTTSVEKLIAREKNEPQLLGVLNILHFAVLI